MSKCWGKGVRGAGGRSHDEDNPAIQAERIFQLVEDSPVQ